MKSENMNLRARLDQQASHRIQSSKSPPQTQMNDETVMSNQTMTTSNLDDEKALEIIELTLLKYQNFLEFLRMSGFGRLIELGELNQQRIQQRELMQRLQQ